MNFETFRPTDGPTLHSQIRDWLLAELASYSLDAKLPTDRELASGLGVAPLTVKRVMGDLEREGYVMRHQGRGTFLTSRERRVHADGKRAEENGEVIIAYPNYFSYEYWARAHHAESQALKAGLGLVEFKMNPTTTYEALITMARKHPRTRGLMIAPIPGSIDRSVFDALDSLGIPVVIFAHCDYLTLGTHVYSVAPNWMQAAYKRVEYLLDHGHQRIAYLANEPAGQDGGESVRYMKQCMRDHDRSSRDLVCLRSGIKAWESSITAAYRMCDELLDRAPVTGVIVDSTSGALGCMRFCEERGLRIPEDLSIVNGGHPTPYEACVHPAITSLYSTFEEQIALAFEAILNPEDQSTREIYSSIILDAGASVAQHAASSVAT